DLDLGEAVRLATDAASDAGTLADRLNAISCAGFAAVLQGRTREALAIVDLATPYAFSVLDTNPAPGGFLAHTYSYAAVLDGRLDEAAWAAAPVTTGLTQREPIEGAEPTQPTEIRIVYDDEAIYVGARMHDPHGVSTRLARRDAFLRDSDLLTVAFDSYHDHLTAFRFSINPSGVRGDELYTGGFRGDDTWDPVWDAATRVDADGWTAELRIPFSQLRFRNRDELVWGVQIEREIARNRETLVLAFTPRSEPGGIPRYGHLVGLSDIPTGERLELLPYAAARAEYRSVELDEDVGFENPYRDGSTLVGRAGLDLKYRLTSNLTLDATVNPDFGQVEADPAEINLSAFETRFDEKRPFFIEGAEIFDFGGGGGGGGPGGGPGGGGGGGGGDGSLFYSRRIGRSPQGEVPDRAVYENMPAATTILGAAKLTGKTAGWSIGVLDALTGRENAPFIDADAARAEAAVEPRSNYVVARARREMRAGESVVGTILTATNRELDGTGLADQLRASAYTAGVDFEHAWAGRVWSLAGHAVASRIAGAPGAIDDAQTSSARYYQRPDATYLDYDPTATSLTGYAAELRLAKEGGLHWRGSAELGAISPGYEINDLGFQRRADELSADLEVEYVENSPGDVFREWNLEAGHSRRWNYGGVGLPANLSAHFRGVLLNYWDINADVRHELEGYDDRFTRGGPLTLAPAETDVSLRVGSDFRKPITVRGRIGRRTGEAGHSTSANLTVGFRPTDQISLEIGPDFSRRSETAQYVT
ncbi:MAG: DUF5916 domain-containing protein, partial [Longimicrobiales bacterium]